MGRWSAMWFTPGFVPRPDAGSVSGTVIVRGGSRVTATGEGGPNHAEEAREEQHPRHPHHRPARPQTPETPTSRVIPSTTDEVRRPQ